MKKWIPIAALAAVGVAAWAYYRKQVSLLKDYSYKIIGVNVRLLQTKVVEIQLKVRLTNESNFEAVMERMYMSVRVEGTDVGFVESTKPVTIPAKSNADVDLKMTFDGQKVITNIVGFAAVLIKQRKINYSLKGFVRLKSRIFKVTIPLDYTSEVVIK